MTRLIVLEGASQASGREKISMVLSNCEPCDQPYQLAMQDFTLTIKWHDCYIGNQLLSTWV